MSPPKRSSSSPAPRGRTARGRSRSKNRSLQLPPARPLLRTTDHGNPILVDAKTLGVQGDRWIDPFLEANRQHLQRLRLTPRVETRGGLRVALVPSERIGAIPLLSPATRKVTAGALVAPRFPWSAVGAVMDSVGFATEPTLGGAPPVPGSAREVPPWLIAGPVLRRIEGLLAHRRRGFVERNEYRASPRGRVDWSAWARRDVPTGRWTQLPCSFAEPDDDPVLIANVRWTLSRLGESLAPHIESIPGRSLRRRIQELQAEIGPGSTSRPTPRLAPTTSAWLGDAIEAMSWVSEERGLGGARMLDGLAWHLPVDELWEAWVGRFCADLAPHLGLTPVRADSTRRGLHWKTHLRSMTSLVPDVVLRGQRRVVVIDAKYKAHFQLLARHGWSGLSEAVRDAHRADLHQALAYAALENVERVDTILAYPQLASSQSPPREAVASIGVGKVRVCLHLLGLPFGFGGPSQAESERARWRVALAV